MIGALGVENAIEHQVTFSVPEDYGSGTFEALTAYTTPDLARFLTYDPATGRLAALSVGPGEQPFPVVFSTPDGAYALGVYSGDLPQARHPQAGFGRFDFSGLRGPGNATMKWNCVFRKEKVQAGDHSFTCYTLVGSLRDVQQGMDRLHARLGGKLPQSSTPAEPPSAAPPPLALAALPELFEEAEYLRCNPDVRRAVDRGNLPSGAVHYQNFGHREARPLGC